MVLIFALIFSLKFHPGRTTPEQLFEFYTKYASALSRYHYTGFPKDYDYQLRSGLCRINHDILRGISGYREDIWTHMATHHVLLARPGTDHWWGPSVSLITKLVLEKILNCYGKDRKQKSRELFLQYMKSPSTRVSADWILGDIFSQQLQVGVEWSARRIIPYLPNGEELQDQGKLYYKLNPSHPISTIEVSLGTLKSRSSSAKRTSFRFN